MDLLFTLESNWQSAEWTADGETVQSDQRRKYQQTKFWLPRFGMCKVFCSLIALRKEEPSIASII